MVVSATNMAHTSGTFGLLVQQQCKCCNCLHNVCYWDIAWSCILWHYIFAYKPCREGGGRPCVIVRAIFAFKLHRTST